MSSVTGGGGTGHAGDPRVMATLAAAFLAWMEVQGYSAWTVRSRRATYATSSAGATSGVSAAPPTSPGP